MYRARLWHCSLAGIVVVMAVTGAACGSSREGRDPRNAAFILRVGELLPLTGELAPFGPAGRKAATIAIDRARFALGTAKVSGISVVAEQSDTRTNLKESTSAARRLLARDVGCLVGPWASANTLSVAQSVASPQRIPIISPASTSAQITALDDNGYVFRTAPSDARQGETLADVIKQDLGSVRGTISIAARDDAYGHGLARSFRRAWKAKGGRIAGPVFYDPEKRNYESEASRIASGSPDAYLVVDFPESYARMGAALVRTGRFDARRLFLADGLALESGAASAGIPRAAIEGARGTRPSTPEGNGSPGLFNHLYSQSPLPPASRETFDAHTFDAVMLCFLAAVAGGSNRPEDIRAHLREVSAPPGRQIGAGELREGVKILREGGDIDYQGASGPLDLDERGDPTAATYDVFEYSSDGAFRVVRKLSVQRSVR